MKKQKNHTFFNTPKTFQETVWLELSPAERLARSWELRKRLKNLDKIHDEKIFPRP